MATVNASIIKRVEELEMWAHGKIIGIQVVTLGLMLTGCETSKDDELGVVPDDDSDTPVASQAEEEHPKHEHKPKHCKVIDAWEPNPSAEEPSIMTWEESGEDFVFNGNIAAYLCPGEEDWYYFETETLDFDDPYILMFAEIGESTRCGAACGNPAVNPGPKYAMSVEVYRADTMALLESRASDDGEVILGDPGAFLHNLLIRVYSPTPNAKYPYSLWILLNDGPYGDDCEC